MKKARLILFLILILLIISTISYFIFIPKLKVKTGNLIEDYIEKEFGIKSEIGLPSGGLFKGVSFKKLEFSLEEAPEECLISISKIIVKFNFLNIFEKKNFISGIILEYPILNVKRDTEGDINLTKFLSKIKKSKEGIKFPFSYIIVKDGKINFIDKFNRKEIFKTSIFIESARLNFKENNEVLLRSLYCLYKRVFIRIEGKIGYKENFKSEINLRADPFYIEDNLNFISEYFPDFYFKIIPVSGKGALNLSIASIDKDVKLNGNLNIKEGSIAGETIRTIKALFNYAGNAFDLKNLKIEVAKRGYLTGSVFFPFSDDLPFNIKVKFKYFPAPCILNFLPFSKDVFRGYLNGKFNLSGYNGSFESFSGGGSIEIIDGAIINPKDIKSEPIDFQRIETISDINRGFINVKKGNLISKDFDFFITGKISFNKELDLKGKVVIEKGKVLKGFFKKLVAPILPDEEKGFRFRLRITGNIASPKIKYSIPKTIIEGLEDNIRDTSNKIEKIFKRIF